MSVSVDMSVSVFPTGLPSPLPSHRWYAYGQGVGDASGGNIGVFLDIFPQQIPGVYRPATTVPAAITLLSCNTLVASQAVGVRWCDRILAGSSVIGYDDVVGSTSASGVLGTYPLRNGSNGLGIESMLRRISRGRDNLYLLSVYHANAAINALIVTCSGFAWDIPRNVEPQLPEYLR